MRGHIRLAGLLCYLVAVFPLLMWLVEGIRDDDLWNVAYYSPIWIWSGTFTAGGLAAFRFNRALAGRLVPLPESDVGECPACGFSARGLSVPRCPECGLDLPADLISSASEKPRVAPPPVQPRDPGSGG